MSILTEQDLAEFYRLLDVEIADFDCGEVCARRNRNRIPYCCDVTKTVPVMYREEYAYARRHTRMWRAYKPGSPDEELDELEYHVHVECRGPERCERAWRSIVCRIFPTYPYLDEHGRAIGLFLNTVLRDKCALADRPELIRTAFIRNHLKFWNLLFDRHTEEREFHAGLSRQTEARSRRLGKPFVIMMPTGTLTKHFENSGEATWAPR